MIELASPHSHRGNVGVRLNRVVTLTPSPAIDRAYFVDTLEHGGLHRAATTTVDLAGKGINVTRALRTIGAPTRAVFPLSNADLLTLGEIVADESLAPVDVPWSARVNAIIANSNGITTNINAAPHPLTGNEWDRLVNATLASITDLGADWLVIAGTLPLVDDTEINLAPLLATVAQMSVGIAIDSSGSGLRPLQDPLVRVDLAKPNITELEELAGRRLRTMGDALDAAERLQSTGTTTILVSLGAQGALLVTDSPPVWITTNPASVVNTTGAGDSFLAGYLSTAQARHPSRAIALGSAKRAVSFGALAVQARSPVPAELHELDGVFVRRIDRSLAIV